MRRLLLISAVLALAALAWGCGDSTVVTPTPKPPQLTPATIGVIEDTTVARAQRVVDLVFTWQTDQASTDVLYYGPHPDSLRDSLVAENGDFPRGDGTTQHVHQAPASGRPALRRPVDTVLFYRVRMKSLDSRAPLGVSDPPARYHTFNPDLAAGRRSQD
ncbi:MAG: hypothetical protein HZB25_04455 [Candidatus Eisenbacteria bacterium]|nr:hypothetical protein [Candidatus Eisenbacteria bacterium]